jgi:DNA-binding response OmpR family regulator
MTQTILVVDDERKLREMIRIYLEQEGYRAVEAGNGREALFVAREEKPDLIILDLMMPEMGGYEFIRAWSKEAETPIIVLTAKVEDGDKILGLELGADDYVTKPFNVRELIARVRAVLRRSQKVSVEPDILRVGDVMLDKRSAILTLPASETSGARDVDLTRSELELLAALMSAPGQIFSRLDLLDRMAGDAYEGYERTIDVHVRNLRAKIEPDARHPTYIETAYGLGYRFASQRRSTTGSD